MNIVYFKEEGHHYYDQDGNQFESVGGLWKPYFKPFNAEEVAIKKAFKDIDSENYLTCKRRVGYDHKDFINELFDNTMLDKEILLNQKGSYIKQWDAKRDLGTAFHAKEEHQDLERGYRINHFTGKKTPVVKWDIQEGWDNQSCPGNLFDIPDGYIPEHLVTYFAGKKAGQIDQNFIETVGKTRYIDIDDWKTDGKVETKPFFHPKKGFATLGFPFDHIYETNYWKYTMKISTYAYFMELLGFTPRNLAFTNIEINDDLSIKSQKRYRIPYKKQEVQMILGHI